MRRPCLPALLAAGLALAGCSKPPSQEKDQPRNAKSDDKPGKDDKDDKGGKGDKGDVAQRQTAPEQTAPDIQRTLADGRPEAAARLGADALRQSGDAAEAARLAELKRQADALAAAAQADDKAARRERCLRDAEAAEKD